MGAQGQDHTFPVIEPQPGRPGPSSKDVQNSADLLEEVVQGDANVVGETKGEAAGLRRNAGERAKAT
eukprot:12883671-Alexandrium_andersonii.AAC.1